MGLLPSVALAWKINEEAFMKNLTWWNEFKLRLGWGMTGQQDINSDFGYETHYTSSDSFAQYPLAILTMVRCVRRLTILT